MNPQLALALACTAAAAGLVLAAWVVLRARSALALPFALLSVDQFGWNCATVGGLLTGDERWRWVGAISAPMFVPFAFHFVIAFIGQRQRLKLAMYSLYAFFGLQGLVAAVIAFAAEGLASIWVRPLSTVLMFSSVPVALFGTALVIQHLRAEGVGRERLRASLLIGALLVMTFFASTDLLGDLGLPLPALSNLGSCAFNLVMAWLVLRTNLMLQDENTRLFARVTSGVISLLGIIVASVSLLLVPPRAGPPVLFLGTLALMLVTVARRFTVAGVERAERLTRVANLGRFSAQMAHDLKNPLAAAQGAIQFLQEEVQQKRSLDPHADFLQVIGDQLRRVTATVDRYQRLSKVEPHIAPLDVSGCVNAVLSLQSFATMEAVRIEKRIAPGLPLLQADVDLISTALENLVKNAFEAFGPSGGTVTVEAAAFEDADGPGVVLSVTDTGPGMDSRTRERAFDPFFTTKATGSGLGLAWVHEVMQAHEGEAVLISAEGQGTRVEMRFWVTSQQQR